jgi:cytochrome c oxidase subunit 1
MLYTLSFIFLFSIGGFTGLINGALAISQHIHDTSFVVAHFHYTMFGGAGFVFFGSLHYWFPKMTGKMYNESRARIAWIIQFVGFNVLYFPLFVIGYMGMPRRYYDYVPKFTTGHVISTIGSWILITGLILMVINLIRSLKKGEPAPANPWGGTTLEWSVSSPPPLENFEHIPEITTGPYNFKEGKVLNG